MESSDPKTLRQHLRALRQRPLEILLLLIWTGLVVYFFGFHTAFGGQYSQSAITQLESAWNVETEYEHAYFIPLIILALLWWSRRKLASAPISKIGSRIGLGILLLGVLFYVAAVRTHHWRIAIGALTFVLFGSALYGMGWKVSKYLLFPILLVYLAIPIPGLLQRTSTLQLIATNAAFHTSSALGVDLLSAGNILQSTTDKWGFNVNEGCSGLRSLMALTLVGAVYAYITQSSLLRGLVLFLSSIPLAIAANALRIITIVLIAEFINPEFAGGSYHDWSGFLFFLACGLAGLMLVHRLLEALDYSTSKKQIKRPATT